MKKKIFKCSKCYFFPLQMEIQNTFLNNMTFVCPLCMETSIFDDKQYKISGGQYEVYYLQSHNADSSKSKLNRSQIEKQQKQFDNYHLILVQMNNRFEQDFYLNPLNQRSKGSFNLSKNEIQRKKDKFILFQLNRKIKSQTIFASGKTLGGTRNSNKKVNNSRRVTKIQHLIYCMDIYINKLVNELNEKDKTNFIIINLFDLERVEEEIKNSSNNKQNPSKQLKNFQLQINLSDLRSYSLLLNVDKQKLEEQQKLKKNQIESQLRLFLIKVNGSQLLNNQNIDQSTKTQNCSMEILQSQKKWNKMETFKNIIVFSHSQLQKQNIQSLISSFATDNQYLRQQKSQFISNIMNFYLQQSIQTNQTNNYPNEKIIKKQNHRLNNFLFFQTCMYIPYAKDKNFQSSLADLFIKIQNLNTINKRKSVNFQSHSNIQNSTNQLQQKRTNQDQNLSPNKNQQIIYIFWSYSSSLDDSKQQSTTQQNSQLNVNKLRSSTILDSLKKGLDRFLQNKQKICDIINFNKFIKEQISNSITNLLIKHVLQQGNLNCQLIRLKRLYCQTKELIFTYIFNFRQILKFNLQELDFLGINQLPDQLKNYSRTYQKIQTKNSFQNPFKKGNNRVHMIIKQKIEESNTQTYYQELSSDQQRETL